MASVLNLGSAARAHQGHASPFPLCPEPIRVQHCLASLRPRRGWQSRWRGSSWNRHPGLWKVGYGDFSFFSCTEFSFWKQVFSSPFPKNFHLWQEKLPVKTNQSWFLRNSAAFKGGRANIVFFFTSTLPLLHSCPFSEPPTNVNLTPASSDKSAYFPSFFHLGFCNFIFPFSVAPTVKNGKILYIIFIEKDLRFFFPLSIIGILQIYSTCSNN